ncbi:hypothetical protein ABZ215_25215 [Amycolatopsis sp. NPDC006131]|uniref:hypothetical protein n=1 Tax=Amycolatopsis sp. NPDC006131 TaxID=3156731 RepID=UPI00339DD85E
MRVTIRETPQAKRGAIRAVLPQMFELGHEIEREMLIHPWHNRTGITERSTFTEVDNLTGKLTVGNNGHAEEGKKVPYWLEFGTSRMHARPWLLPALIRVSLRRKFQARGRRR